MLKRILLLFVIVVVLVVAVGYANSSKTTQADNGKKTMFTLYYSDQDIMNLITEKRQVVVPYNMNPVKAALMELAKTPKDKNAVVLWPEGTEVLHVTAADGIVYIDFNEKITANFIGGSGTEAMLITSIVNTVTDVKDYEDLQVQFLVNGEIIETIGGHIGAQDPFSRYDKE